MNGDCELMSRRLLDDQLDSIMLGRLRVLSRPEFGGLLRRHPKAKFFKPREFVCIAPRDLGSAAAML